MKICWNCESKINDKAKVCKFCKSVQLMIQSDEKKTDEKKSNAEPEKIAEKC